MVLPHRFVATRSRPGLSSRPFLSRLSREVGLGGRTRSCHATLTPPPSNTREDPGSGPTLSRAPATPFTTGTATYGSVSPSYTVGVSFRRTTTLAEGVCGRGSSRSPVGVSRDEAPPETPLDGYPYCQSSPTGGGQVPLPTSLVSLTRLSQETKPPRLERGRLSCRVGLDFVTHRPEY